MIIKLITTGYCILIIAITANMIATYFDIVTWYNFLKDIYQNGFKNTIYAQNLFDLIWLFIIYPITLTIGAFLGNRLYEIF